MSGAKYFAELNMSNVYWQIRVDEESSKLLTFNTPFGRFKFKQLPFGIHSASEICQEAIARVIEGVDNCANEQDDIIIWGHSKEQLHNTLKNVLYRVQKCGMKLNLAKCIFEATEITYLGHILSGDGIELIPKNICNS